MAGSNFKTWFAALTSVAPADADSLPVLQGGVTKRSTFTNVKAFLKTYFDTLYATLASVTANTASIATNTADILLRETIAHASATYATIASLASYAQLGVAQTFTKPQRGAIATLVSASNLIAVDLSLSDNFKITLAQNNTLSNPSNAVEGQSGVITFIQDGTGSRTMAFGSFWDFAGVTPALSTAANAVDHLSYYVEPGAARARVQLSKE